MTQKEGRSILCFVTNRKEHPAAGEESSFKDILSDLGIKVPDRNGIKSFAKWHVAKSKALLFFYDKYPGLREISLKDVRFSFDVGVQYSDLE